MSIEATSFRPLHAQVFVADLEHGVRKTEAGILIPDDNMSNRGIRERWARVYAIGPEVEGVEVGEWVLVEHGRWTNGIDFTENGEPIKLWRIDYPDAVLLASDTNPALRSTRL